MNWYNVADAVINLGKPAQKYGIFNRTVTTGFYAKGGTCKVHARKRSKFFIAILMVGWLTLTSAGADTLEGPKPSKKDRCPVCGMFVYKYPDWVGVVKFSDHTTRFFDGAKDLFKFYFDLKSYVPQKTQADISAIYVTEYYNVKLINARDAYYVIGSNVYGPMGHELIPFESEADAREFMRDHNGKRILKFKNIKPSIIEKLD